jgi:hypothetical protein
MWIFYDLNRVAGVFHMILHEFQVDIFIITALICLENHSKKSFQITV